MLCYLKLCYKRVFFSMRKCLYVIWWGEKWFLEWYVSLYIFIGILDKIGLICFVF